MAMWVPGPRVLRLTENMQCAALRGPYIVQFHWFGMVIYFKSRIKSVKTELTLSMNGKIKIQ